MRTNRHSAARDAALRRLTNLNRLLVAGSVVGAGLLTEVAAQAFPGHSSSAARSASERAAAVARERAHTRTHARSQPKKCHVCAPGRDSRHPSNSSSTAPNSAGEDGSATPPAASSSTAPASTPPPAASSSTAPASTPPPAATPPPAPAPAPAPAPVVVSGGS